MNTEFDPDKLILSAIEKAQELISNNKPDMAQDIAKQILRCQPNHVDATELLGLTHHQKHEYPQAIKYLKKAVESQPNNADFLNNLALPLSVTGKVDESIELLKKCVELQPENPQYLANLALQYRSVGKITEAIETLKKSLSFKELPTTYVNLGGTYGESHQLELATECFRKAIELDPENAMAHTDLAYSLHLEGNYKEAWKEYEWRFKGFSQIQPYMQKYDQNIRWDGSPLPENCRIMIYCEQGLGDAIQFVRFIQELKNRYSCYVILHCSESLVELFKQSDLGIDEFFTIPIMEMTWIVPHDYHASLMSLPFLLNIENIPLSEPYLKSEGIDLGYSDKKKIGICWAGSPLHPNDRIRSLHLRHFQEIHDLPDVKLFNLCDSRIRKYVSQDREIDLTLGCDGMRIVDCWEKMTDFAKTASIVKGLDLVITVDTALMHLSSGLGVPTIGLLSYNPDWRWGLTDKRTPWYRNLILIRQMTPGIWDSVFSELKNLI